MRANQSAWQSPDSGLMRAANSASKSANATPQSTTTTRRLGRRQRQPGDSAIDPIASLDEEMVSDDEDWDGIQASPPARSSKAASQQETTARSRPPIAGRSPLPEPLNRAQNAAQRQSQPNAASARQHRQPVGQPERQPEVSNRPLELPSFAERKVPNSHGTEVNASVNALVNASLGQQPLAQPARSAKRPQQTTPEEPDLTMPAGQRSSVAARVAFSELEPGEESGFEPGAESDVNTELPQSVWMQVQRVNQLSAELAAALLELRSLSLTVQPGHPSTDGREDGAEPDQLRWEAETAVVPYVQPEMDAYVVRTRPVDLAQVQPSISPHGRSSSRRSGDRYPDPPSKPPMPAPHSYVAQAAFPPAVPFTALDPPHQGRGRAHASGRNRQDWFARLLQPPTTTLGILNDALSWVVGAGIARIGLELVRMVHPALWTPALLLLLAVLLWGGYRGLIVMRSKPILAYRLVLVLVGLVLGGKFWTR